MVQPRLKLESETMCCFFFYFLFPLFSLFTSIFFYLFFLTFFFLFICLPFFFFLFYIFLFHDNVLYSRETLNNGKGVEKVEQREEREVIWSVGVVDSRAERDMGEMEHWKKSGIDEPSPSSECRSESALIPNGATESGWSVSSRIRLSF